MKGIGMDKLECEQILEMMREQDEGVIDAVNLERVQLSRVFREAQLKASDRHFEQIKSLSDLIEDTVSLAKVRSAENSSRRKKEKISKPSGGDFLVAASQDSLELYDRLMLFLKIFNNIQESLFAKDTQRLEGEIYLLFEKFCVDATNWDKLKNNKENNKLKTKTAADARYRKTRDLKFQAINTAMELWDEPGHETKTHDKMAKHLIEEYHEGDLHPFSELKYTGLKKALKDHLKEIDRTDLIFNG